MFDETGPHVFGLPCGIDYPREVVRGLRERLSGYAPEELARVEIFANTSKLARAIEAAFDREGDGLKPRVRLLSDLANTRGFRDIPAPATRLKRQIEIGTLVGAFLDSEPTFAPRSSLFDLADSLATVVGEMQDQGVTPDQLATVDVPEAARHWQDALRFFSIAYDYLNAQKLTSPTQELRFREAVTRCADLWLNAPPKHPVLVVGSTGSRETTAWFMELVSKLDKGAVILPGFDPDTPQNTWRALQDGELVEHPQERIARFSKRVGVDPASIPMWTHEPPPRPARNRLISLALRPAPFTDEWMRDGPLFQDLGAALSGMTLIETPDLRSESTAVALIMRYAVHAGETCALVTPDRNLARRVTAALARWGIQADDSAGIPLGQTPPARLLRHLIPMLGKRTSTEDLLVLLKHPLTASGAAPDGLDRGWHLLWTRELETYLRRGLRSYPSATDLSDWVAEKTRHGAKGEFSLWATWVEAALLRLSAPRHSDTVALINHMVDLAEWITAGPAQNDSRPLWAKSAGRATRQLVDDLRRETSGAPDMSYSDFTNLFLTALGQRIVRAPDGAHPLVSIWGTQEARLLSAERVILAGLNESVWPQPAAVDPWFSRDMRRQAGLLSPDQSTGLAAHDFQQAIAAKHVFLTRSKRDAEAETVPSRWLARMTNLLAGMSPEGAAGLKEIRCGGDKWVDWAMQIDVPPYAVPPATRPSPAPPADARPRQLSVTRLETLIRDPYQIYAGRILKLDPLPALSRNADARDRGTAIHAVMESFVQDMQPQSVPEAAARLLGTAERILGQLDDHPATVRLWLGRLRRLATQLAENELARFEVGEPVALEARGTLHLDAVDFSVTGKADRIDRRRSDGKYLIYDYKTGAPPNRKQIEHFSIQLLVEALMLEEGKFDNLTCGPVGEVRYLGLDSKLTEVDIAISDEVRATRAKLLEVIRHYDNPEKGYTARRALQAVTYASDYDHLSRFGEWSDWDTPQREIVG